MKRFRYHLAVTIQFADTSLTCEREFRSNVQFREGDMLTLDGLGDATVGYVAWRLGNDFAMLGLDDLRIPQPSERWRDVLRESFGELASIENSLLNS